MGEVHLYRSFIILQASHKKFAQLEENMKKLTRNLLFLAAIIAAVFVLDSCFHGSGSDLSEPTASSTPFNYNYLTANRKFIGGSLIYDPSDTSGKLAQISSGTKIGVRLGKLTKKEKH